MRKTCQKGYFILLKKLVVSTGNISSDARKYAQNVMNSTNLNIIFIDLIDLQKIVDNPTYIADALNREARHAMEIKKLQLSK